MQRIYLPLIVSLAALSANAETIESTAGNLHSLVENPADITSLSLSGTLNAGDFRYMASSMPSLREIDLSAISILATDTVTINGRSSFPAATIPAFAFSGSKITNVVLPSATTAVGEGAFADSDLESITLGENISSVGSGSFVGCTKLSKIEIGCAGIDEGAFSNCTALREVDITSSSLALRASVFSGCSALSSITNTEAIWTLGDNCFRGCSALDSFECSSSLAGIGSHAFTDTSISSLNLSSTKITSLPEWALADMPYLETVSATGVTVLGKGSLMGCPLLREATFSPSLNSVGDYALALNPSLNQVDLGQVKSLGAYSLSHDSGISDLELPATLSSVGDGAMESATGLSTIHTLAVAVPATGKAVWNGVDQKNVTLLVPDESLNLYSDAPQWQEFNIVAESMSGVSGLNINMSQRIRCRFIDDNLVVESMDLPIETIVLHDISGSSLGSYTFNSNLCEISTADFLSNIFIVTVNMTDGSSPSVKIARR